MSQLWWRWRAERALYVHDHGTEFLQVNFPLWLQHAADTSSTLCSLAFALAAHVVVLAEYSNSSRVCWQCCTYKSSSLSLNLKLLAGIALIMVWQSA
jgi:hypothetical protein